MRLKFYATKKRIKPQDGFSFFVGDDRGLKKSAENETISLVIWQTRKPEIRETR